MKKVFVITMFGTPFPWIQDYIDNVQHLEKDGWYWKIFTPEKIESKGNVEIVNMDTEAFNKLIFDKLGVTSHFYVTPDGRPSVHVTDYYVATGKIFEDYLKDADFWGITNLDVVYGNLSKFVPNHMLELSDVFSDDTNSINGVFSLFKNIPEINSLYEQIPDWIQKFQQQPCPKCTGTGDQHTLYGTDEYDMSELVDRKSKEMKLMYAKPLYHPLHSHDRLEQHVPNVKLEIRPDGSLWELFADTKPPQWVHARPFIGREIPYFHFCKTKEWPKCLKS